MKMIEKKNYGYVRVSGKKQVKKGFSIDEQIEELLEKAKSMGEILGREDIFVDKAHTGTNVKRPELKKLLQEIAKGNTKTVFIICSDRLTRNKIHKYSLKCVFIKYNTKIISCNEDWESTSIEAEFSSDIKTLVDELEVKKISPRTYRGLKGSARMGNYTMGGIPPRGFEKIFNSVAGKGSKLVPIPDHKQYIINIFEYLADNKYSKCGLAKLYNKEEVMGIKWNEDRINHIIENPIYYGRYVTPYIDLENHTEAIISKELFDRCHATLESNNRRTDHFYIFDKMVYCSDCDTYCKQESAWKTSSDGKRKKLYLYYKCGNCNKRVNENFVTEKVASYLNNKKYPSSKLKTLEILNAKLKNISIRERYYERDFDEGLIGEDELREKYLDTRLKAKEIREEIAQIENSIVNKFESLSKNEKRHTALQHIKRIDVNLKNREKSINNIIACEI